MKKIIGIILLVQTLLIMIVGLQALNNISYTNLLYEDNMALLIRADSSEDNANAVNKLLSYFADEKKNEDITISKYAYVNNNDLAIYTNDITLNGKIDIEENEDFAGDCFIANYDSGNPKQIGKFYIFNPKLKITVYPLEQIKNSGVDGLYYVADEYADIVTERVNAGIGYAEVYNDFSVSVASAFEDSLELIISIGLTILILIVVTTHYMIKRAKKIAIVKIHGYSVLASSRNIFKELYRTQFIAFVFGITGTVLYGIYHYGKENLFVMCKMFMFAFVITNLLYAVVVIIVLFLEHKTKNVALLIKGKRQFGIIFFLHLMLKSVFLITLMIGCSGLIEQIKNIEVQQDNLKIWEKAENIYSINLNYVGESRESEIKLKQFYDLINENMDAFLIDTQNYEMVDEENHLYDYNAPGEESFYDPYGKTITINENYMKQNPITINGNAETVMTQIMYDENVRNILVPNNLKKYESEIQRRFLKDFYFQKVEVENTYNEKLGNTINSLTKENLKINIIYVDENQEYFPYCNVEENNGCKIINPIVVLETGNIDYSYYMAYLSRCVYFKYDGMNPFDYLLPFIRQTDVLSNVKSVDSVYDNHGQEIYNMEVRRNYLVIALSVVMLLFIVVGFVIISSYYQEKKYQIYVKKIFGFSMVQRIYKLLIMLLALDFTMIMVAGAVQSDNLILIFGSSVVLLDFILTMIEGGQLDKKNFNSIIKGGTLMIEIKNLSKKYGRKEIFHNLSFCIEENDFVAITGESGKGKTTLLNIISLLDSEYSGRIIVDGKKTFSERDIQKIQRYKFAYLFQNYALVENETVRQNLEIALKFKRQHHGSSIKKALKLVGLEGIEGHKIYELSGGEQQRVAMARAFLKEPKYIFADEPTGNLDKQNRDVVFSLLEKMNQSGITVVFVTHDMELAQRAKSIIQV